MRIFAFITLMCAESIDTIISGMIKKGYTIGPGFLGGKLFANNADTMKMAASAYASIQISTNGDKKIALSDAFDDLKSCAKNVKYYSMSICETDAAMSTSTNIDVGDVKPKAKKNVPYLKAVEDKKLSSYDGIVDDSEANKNV